MQIKICLNDNEIKLINKASNITNVDYELKGNEIELDNFICCIEDLALKIDELKDNIEEIEKDRDENYKPITNEEVYLPF